jgi:hypothetical protein
LALWLRLRSGVLGGGRIYVRTEKVLWCVGSKAAPLP